MLYLAKLSSSNERERLSQTIKAEGVQHHQTCLLEATVNRTNKLHNIEEMDTFLEIPPRLNHEETENLNRPIMSKEIDSVIKNFPTQKALGPSGFTGEFYQIFRVNSDLFQILPNINEKGTFSNSFSEACITLTTKPSVRLAIIKKTRDN